jgi:hypothetical protein
MHVRCLGKDGRRYLGEGIAIVTLREAPPGLNCYDERRTGWENHAPF